MANNFSKRGTMKRGVVLHEFGPLAELFRLLSDRTRLHILMLLSDGERSVGSLCDALSLPQPTVSHHLGLLRMQNLIVNRRNGKNIIYGLNGHVKFDVEEGFSIAVERYNVRVCPKNI